MLGILGDIVGGITNFSDTVGTIKSGIEGFSSTEGNLFNKIQGGVDGVNDFQKGVDGSSVDMSETNAKLDTISNSLSNIENQTEIQTENNIVKNKVQDARNTAPTEITSLGDLPAAVGSNEKKLTSIETSEDPLTQRSSDAKRYQKFNSIAMGGIGLRQNSPFKMGVETTEAKTGMSEEDTKAAKEEPTEENSEENNEKDSGKTKKKAAVAKAVGDGLAAGFNAYASAIAQQDEVKYDDKGFAINTNNVKDKPAPFTVHHKIGKNSGALVSNDTSGSIGADKDVLVNNSNGEEKTLKTVYKASF
tara:strand:- start:3327 stop:4238 length:912 start_codon:yes stop_codon:yes gene_type:complete